MTLSLGVDTAVVNGAVAYEGGRYTGASTGQVCQ
jgi:hypothetical protein